jgi:hypothetical protein
LLNQRDKVAGWFCDGKGGGVSLVCGKEDEKVWDKTGRVLYSGLWAKATTPPAAPVNG